MAAVRCIWSAHSSSVYVTFPSCNSYDGQNVSCHCGTCLPKLFIANRTEGNRAKLFYISFSFLIRCRRRVSFGTSDKKESLSSASPITRNKEANSWVAARSCCCSCSRSASHVFLFCFFTRGKYTLTQCRIPTDCAWMKVATREKEADRDEGWRKSHYESFRALWRKRAAVRGSRDGKYLYIYLYIDVYVVHDLVVLANWYWSARRGVFNQQTLSPHSAAFLVQFTRQEKRKTKPLHASSHVYIYS